MTTSIIPHYPRSLVFERCPREYLHGTRSQRRRKRRNIRIIVERSLVRVVIFGSATQVDIAIALRSTAHLHGGFEVNKGNRAFWAEVARRTMRT